MDINDIEKHTYGLLTSTNKTDRLTKRLMAYVEAINKIDDYFEYRASSSQDTRIVRKILTELTNKLKDIT